MRPSKRFVRFSAKLMWTRISNGSVADSALYTTDKLLANNEYLWLTRVPETILEARDLVSKGDGEVLWQESENGYRHASFVSSHGGIEQRWLLVYSEQAFMREKKTFEKNFKTKEAALMLVIWHLGNEVFGCKQDAE
jgi:transposase